MKILLDMNLSPAWKLFLNSSGYQAEHWSNIGSPNASDEDIMKWARKNAHSVFTHDLDFSAILYLTNATEPSVIQLRTEDIRPASIGKIVLAALNDAKEAIEKGAIVTIDPKRKRVRLLPLRFQERE